MMDQPKGLRLVFHHDPITPHINVVNTDYNSRMPGGTLESDDWDGDQYIMLCPTDQEAHVQQEQWGATNDSPIQTLERTMQGIRNKPRLALLNMAVVRNLEDSLVLWTAWKASMLETIGTLYEDKALLLLQQRTELDQESVTLRLRELRMQVQTTTGVWREHLNFLTEERQQLTTAIDHADQNIAASAAVLQKKYTQLAQATQADRCIATVRVLINAVAAVNATYEERRHIFTQRGQFDRTTHVDALRSLSTTLQYFLQGLAVDLDGIKLQCQQAQQLVDQSIQQKEHDWRTLCQRLQEHYSQTLHVPLQAIIKDVLAQQAQAWPTAFNLASTVLTNANDPYCLRRCEIALLEILQLQTVVAPPPLTTNVSLHSGLDDATLSAARAQRQVEMAQADQDYAYRCVALTSERENKEAAVERARHHLQALQDQAAQLRAHVNSHWLETTSNAATATPDANKRTAAFMRVAQQREHNLTEEMQRTQASITQLGQELKALCISQQDRVYQLQALTQLTRNIYDLCRHMRTQFELSIQTEDMMRRIVQDQFLESARTFYNTTLTVIHATVALSEADFQRTRVYMEKLNDDIQDTTRRIDTLTRARIEQELKVDGPEIAVYTALEEHVVITNETHALRDKQANVTAMCDTCQAALSLLQDLSNSLQGI